MFLVLGSQAIHRVRVGIGGSYLGADHVEGNIGGRGEGRDMGTRL